MPFTLFHMGASLFGKGVSPKTQSVLFFGACQVAIDLEPAVKMLMDYQGSLHSVAHSPIGALVTVVLTGLLWSWSQKQSWWRKDIPSLSKSTLFHTAWWAALSHLLLDSMSHQDIPYSVSHRFGIEMAENVSIGLGIVGLVLLSSRWLVRKIIDAVQAHRTKHRQN